MHSATLLAIYQNIVSEKRSQPENDIREWTLVEDFVPRVSHVTTPEWETLGTWLASRLTVETRYMLRSATRVKIRRSVDEKELGTGGECAFVYWGSVNCDDH